MRDSLRIFGQFFRFTGSSIACAVVDLLIFALISSALNLQTAVLVTLATVVARLASGVLNFGLNRGFSFQDLGSGSGDVRTQGVRYTMLFLVQMCASALLVVALSIMPLPLVMVKAFVDGSLFVLSYFVQRNWVFKRDTHTQAVRAKGGKRGEVKSKKTYSAI
jgi:putative flippase GtrA